MDYLIAHDFCALSEEFSKKGWALRVTDAAFVLDEFGNSAPYTYQTIKELRAALDMLEHAAQSYRKLANLPPSMENNL